MINGDILDVKFVAFSVNSFDTKEMEEKFKKKYPNDIQMDSINIDDMDIEYKKQQTYFNFLVDTICNTIQYYYQDDSIIKKELQLTIFSFPEFFFKNRNSGCFSKLVIKNGLDYMKYKLSSIKQKNFLVVPGTIWWYSFENISNEKTPFMEVNTTAPVFYNNELIKKWNKQLITNIDGCTNLLYYNYEYYNKFIALKRDYLLPNYTQYKKQYDSISDTDSYFQVKVSSTLKEINVFIGLESGLDHTNSYLKTCGMTDLDIHLMINAGTNIISNNIACRNGGLFLLCDSISDETDLNHFSNCIMINRSISGDISSTKQNTYKYYPEYNIVVYDLITIKSNYSPVDGENI